MKFTENLWNTINPIYQRILEHPFNVELANGILDKKRFIFYIEQDAYYLKSFSKALALIAGRAVSSKTIYQFLHFSFGSLTEERELHASFLNSNYNYDDINPSPSCIAYTQYLIATAATASLEEAVSAILPCFWIYREVGHKIAENCSKTNPYIRWIETYSSQEFSEATDLVICLLDLMASRSSSEVLESMKAAFKYCALFEWHFWNDAYKMIAFEDSII